MLLVDYSEDFCDDAGFVFCHCQASHFKSYATGHVPQLCETKQVAGGSGLPGGGSPPPTGGGPPQLTGGGPPQPSGGGPPPQTGEGPPPPTGEGPPQPPDGEAPTLLASGSPAGHGPPE